ncbi:MAG: stage V sporulation T C-terminal domain-containing protein [bacterium]|nr:stage V sporulation T C-terminal domain-containing protein [bacterium]
MKAIGVVRRIDDLGRVVIPKEIRKTLKIKDGESVEIFVDRENIILKKYHPFGGAPDFYKDYVDAIYSELGGNIMIADRDRIVAASGELKKDCFDKPISKQLEEIIHSRSVVVCRENSNISVAENHAVDGSYVIAPVISNGDEMGAVIILFMNKIIDDFSVKTGIIASKFLEKYVE